MNIRTLYDLLFEVEGAHLCLKVQLIHVLNSLQSITIVLDIEVSFRVENAFRVAMLFGSSSSAEVLQIHMNCDVVVQHLFLVKTVAQTMVD